MRQRAPPTRPEPADAPDAVHAAVVIIGAVLVIMACRLFAGVGEPLPATA